MVAWTPVDRINNYATADHVIYACYLQSHCLCGPAAWKEWLLLCFSYTCLDSHRLQSCLPNDLSIPFQLRQYGLPVLFSFCLFVCVTSVCLSVRLSFYLSVGLTACLPLFISVRCLFFLLSINVCLFACLLLSVYQYVYLSSDEAIAFAAWGGPGVCCPLQSSSSTWRLIQFAA